MPRFPHYLIKSFLVIGAGFLFAAIASSAVGFSYNFLNPLKSGSNEIQVAANNAISRQERGVSTLSLGSVKERITIPSEGVVAHADLKQKTLTIYTDGVVTEPFPIVSIGRPGSPWETPAGDYSIKTKEKRHFSSIGHVWMPYSMQFYGNFFIHGWPYYASGGDVPHGYSGGCIRLSTADAEKVYGLMSVGSRVVVTGTGEELSDAPLSGRYYRREDFPLPDNITAEAYAVADLDTGEIILEERGWSPLPVASITKLMTALVSLEIINQFSETTISERAVETFGDSGGLRAGDTIPIGDLLYPLLLESDNDAAEAIAEHTGRNRFIQEMNTKAKAIGLKETHFVDPSGLDSRNVSTVVDLLRILRFLADNKKHVLELTMKPSYHVSQDVGHPAYSWRNRNQFLTDPTHRGSKNGFTEEAGQTLVAMFELPLEEFQTRHIGIALLKSKDRKGDTEKIITYLGKGMYFSRAVHEEETGAASLKKL